MLITAVPLPLAALNACQSLCVVTVAGLNLARLTLATVDIDDVLLTAN